MNTPQQCPPQPLNQSCKKLDQDPDRIVADIPQAT